MKLRLINKFLCIMALLTASILVFIAIVPIGSLPLNVSYLENQLNNLQARLAFLERERSGNILNQVEIKDWRQQKRIVVTGGAGFVGSHLVDRLMEAGNQVIVIDNFFTGSRRNLFKWIGHPNFELLHHDITLPIFLEVDQIYHLASPASPLNYMLNPVKTLKTNLLGTINMLGMARRNHARLLLASTSEVYGDPLQHPQTENYWGNVNSIGPRSCYDEGKRAAEALAYAYARQERVQVRVARIFNTYGPRMQLGDGRVVSNFMTQALRGEPITVYGRGRQTRSFQYVSDLVEGLVRLMNSNYSQPVNLGNPEEHDIAKFAVIINDLVGNRSSIVYKEAAIDDPRRRQPDITVAKRELSGWRPLVRLEDGLRKTATFFRKELKRREIFASKETL